MSFAKKLLTSNKQNYKTPINLFNWLNGRYDFTLDVAASYDNALCKKFYTEQTSGLKHSWKDETVFCNPPYNKIKDWIRKILYEIENGCDLVCLLVPARVDTEWFYKCWLYADEIKFIKGRLNFDDAKDPAVFPSVLIIFRYKKDDRYLSVIHQEENTFREEILFYANR